jgi:hypothetical protein
MLEPVRGEEISMKAHLARGWVLLARLTLLAATLGGVALLVGFARKSGY